MRNENGRERGSILLAVAVFLAVAIAGLAGISSGRVVYASKSQRVMERETRAFNSAYAQIHMSMNVVNNSAYNEENQNLELRWAVAGLNGGTFAGEDGSLTRSSSSAKDAGGDALYIYKDGQAVRLEKAGGEQTGYVEEVKQPTYGDVTVAGDEASKWLDHEDDPRYGLIASTNVRVYHAREYISRLQRLRGEPVTDVDPGGLSSSYYVLEAAGRVGNTIRLVSALVRENEPFSSFVFFQNRATLGVSGSPRGLTHSNEKIAFYFPNGNYVDTVSAVGGFEYMAGAEPENTNLRDANPEAARIDLEQVDFVELKGKADLFVGQDGLDAQIKLYSNGKVRIKEYTPPRYEVITKSRTYRKRVGSHYETYTTTKKVQVGTKKVSYQDQVVDYYKTETYWVTEKVKVGTKTETKYKTVQVQVGTKTETKYKTVKVQVGTKKVQKTKQEPVYETQTVTKYKKVKVWVPYNTGEAGGGTSVGGGGGGGALGEYVWVNEPYQTTEKVQVGTKTVTYWVDEPVYEMQKQAYTVKTPIYETQTQAYTVKTPIYEYQKVKKTKKTPVYKTVTKWKDEPVYEYQEVTKRKKVNDYEYITKTWEKEVYQRPVYKGRTYIRVNEDNGGTVYIDGRVTRLYGDLNGRLTIVGNEKVRITGNVRYVDKRRNRAMKNGTDYAQSYLRNEKYQGNSVLGVIARDDILFTRYLPSSTEINGTLMSVNGRVGIDGFWAKPDGELATDSSKNRQKYLTEEQQMKERAYDRRGSTKTKRFTKNSLRRIGGIISNNRIMETYITTKSDGTSKVSAGYKRGNMKFDINMLFNPPPNFVEVPRPVLTYFVPILMVRTHDA